MTLCSLSIIARKGYREVEEKRRKWIQGRKVEEKRRKFLPFAPECNKEGSRRIWNIVQLVLGTNHFLSQFIFVDKYEIYFLITLSKNNIILSKLDDYL